MSIVETTTRLDYRSLQNKKKDWLVDVLVSAGKELEKKDARIKELEAREPDEEDMAVLWLMKREDYDVCFERDHFAVYRRVEDTDNDWCWVSDSPADEAKKLGWGGGE